MQRLTSIDVFSGIGGISSALNGIVQTVLYCERDEYCRDVLLERMGDGMLDKAPIHGDIRNLHVPKEWNAVMLSGGFPCQDISSIGLQKGINQGERSTLFYEMMRIAKESSTIQVIFFENVANIIKLGLTDVVQECCMNAGFDLKWIVKSAGELGAPHVRNRWFALACKKTFSFEDYDMCFGVENAVGHCNWDNEPKHRFTFKPDIKADESWDPKWSRRCATLGNAVVPKVVREAFLELVQSHKDWRLLADTLSAYSIPVQDVVSFPDAGLVVDGKMIQMPLKQQSVDNDKVSLHITLGDEKINYVNFPTPRHGNTHAASLTARGSRDLPTVLTNCDETIEIIKSLGVEYEVGKIYKVVVPNVNYIEWMMGFPQDWTKVKSVPKSAPDEIEDETAATVVDISSPPKKSWVSGFHIFIRDNPGKDIRYAAQRWRTLTPEEKQRYKDMKSEYQVKVA